MTPQICFYLKIFFLDTDLKRTKKRVGCSEWGVEGGMYIKDWLKPLFPVFII